MIIWKNTCGESWQDTIENGWEVSGKPGAFLFFIPKGALTHHLLKQAVVALPLVGHVRSPRGIATPAGAAGQGCISAKLPALPMQSAQGFPFWKPLFMGWYIATPSRRLPASTCRRQLDTDTGGNESFRPCWWCVVFHDALSENKGALFRGTPFRKDKVIYGDLSLEAKIVSRGAGRSAVAAAAYLSCSRMLNEYDGVQHDYTRKQGLGWRQVFLPATAPVEWQDREILWNAVEETETAKDSRLAREFVAALPIELSREKQIQLLQDFIKEQFVADGMCADAAIHDPYPPGHNPHAHILLTVRPLDEKGKWQYKTEKEYLCVKDGEERGFTAAEFKQAQADGWEKQYQYKVGKRRCIWPRPQRRRRAMNGYPNILKAPNMAGKIPSQNAGTATSSLFCGGLHGRMWQTTIWSAPGTKNASTTAAMPNVACWSGLRSMRGWLPEPWRKGHYL